MQVEARTTNKLYKELWWKIKTSGITQPSRNGPVISIPEPVLFTLSDPTQRILTCPVRDCNPFFHIAEVVWMLAGSNDVRFVELFNRRYREYADEGTDKVWGAYGYRWRMHWDIDQIRQAIWQLKRNPDSRQVVISMWDPVSDLNEDPHSDRPCNTQIMFRVVHEKLNMLVTNRSNDLVWGAMGANIVHFTYLHELIAAGAGIELGKYQVVTNNLHVYPNMPRFDEIRDAGLGGVAFDRPIMCTPILQPWERPEDLLGDCFRFVFGTLHNEIPTFPEDYDRWNHYRDQFLTQWMQTVAVPMMMAYLNGPSEARQDWISRVVDDWKGVARDWSRRRGGV